MNTSHKPKGAWITVNRSCNFRCAGCYAAGTGYKTSDDMPLELALRILDLTEELGIRKLIVIGGEPTLWKPLLDFNRICTDRGIKTTLVTNAMMFGSDEFWERYQQSPNSSLGISIKAHDPSSLQKIAQVTVFDKVRGGIQRALSLMPGGVSTVLGAGAEPGHLLHMAQFAMDCGAKMFSVSPCTPSLVDGKPDGSSVMHPHDFVQYVVGAYPEIDCVTQGKFVISVKTPLCLWPRDFMEMLIEKRQLNTVCQLHKHTGVIFSVDGSALICNSLFEYPVGKLGEDFDNAESLTALLNSEATLSLYRPLTSYASQKCIHCPKHSVCAAGCPLFWTLYNPNELISGW